MADLLFTGYVYSANINTIISLNGHYRYLAIENEQLVTWAIKQLPNKVNNRRYSPNNKDKYSWDGLQALVQSKCQITLLITKCQSVR